MTTLAGHDKDPRLVQAELPIVPKVGDRVKDADGFIGVVSLVSNKCINVTGSNSIKSWNLEECLNTGIGLEVLEPSVMQPDSHAAKSKQSDIRTSAKMPKQSINQTFPMSQSLETSEKLSHQQESTYLQEDFPVQEPQTLEPNQDSCIQSLLSGLNISELSTKDDPDSLSLRTPPQLSITDYEQYLEESEWLDIVGTIRKSYKQLSSEVPKNAKDCLSLPTLTTNKGVTSRSSGQSKCEKWFRDKGLLQDTQCLSPQMMAALFGFPTEWTKCLWDAQGDRRDALEADISSEELSTLTAASQSSNESSTSIAASVLVVNNSSPRERLAYLLSERNRLIAMGASPQGIWIEKSKPAKKPFEQAVWKSAKPRPEWDGKKSKYIGEYGKENHISAIAQHKAGQELRKIEREIKKLQVKS